MFGDLIDRDAPAYVCEVLAEHGRAAFKVLRDPVKRTRSRHSEPVVISVVKNEFDRLADFFQHYRALGTEQFFFIDNGSTDGTVEYLCQQSDCFVRQINEPFDWRKKHGWITLAIDMIGRGRDEWYVFVDADEHLAFDGSEKRSIGELCRRMEKAGIRRVRGMLVDMYRDGPLLGSTYKPGTRLIEAYPFFDGSGYDEKKFREIMSRKGGPRQRVFGPADANFRPEMSKYPIFKLANYDVFANPHHIWPYEENFHSPCYLGLLHYKFLPDTLKRIEAAVREENYWGGSIEYKCYKKILSQNQTLSLMGPSSVRYESSASFLAAKLIAPLP